MGKVQHIACMEKRKGVYRVLVGTPKENKPLRRHRHRWEENIKMYLQNVRWRRHRLRRSGPGQGEVVGSCECIMNLQFL